MKIFNEEEVNKASLQYSTLIHSTDELDSIEAEAFAAGVEYAESKVEDLCIEFAEWMFTPPMILTDDNGGVGSNVTTSELFQEFLKERNNENR